ncbi:MAG TPA: hypothetical protein VN915_06700 [Elusimicrobiota bacterium]|nr:hypothetical protein [Elusimicrobiota bacterium]
MTAAEIVLEFARLHRGKIVTPTIVQAWAQTRNQRVSASALAEQMRRKFTPFRPGAFVVSPKPFPWPQGKLL